MLADGVLLFVQNALVLRLSTQASRGFLQHIEIPLSRSACFLRVNMVVRNALPLLRPVCVALLFQSGGVGPWQHGGTADLRPQGGGRLGAGESQRSGGVRASQPRLGYPGGVEELREPGDEGAGDVRAVRVGNNVSF